MNGTAGTGPLDQVLLRLADVRITTGSVAAALIALLGTGLVMFAVRRSLARYGRGRGSQYRATLYTLQRIASYSLLAIGVFIAVSLLGVPLSRLAVVAGAVGVGLGFGLQAIFSNFISGLILLFDKSLKVGDFVELESGVNGEVRDIKIRATRIVTNDNQDIIVPNSEFVTGRVVNWTHRDVSRRLRVPFGVAYGTDKEMVKEAALEAASEVPFTLAHEGPQRPQVWLVEFGDSSLNYELVVWLTAEATKRPAAVRAAYMWALHSALARHDLAIPFPQHDLHVRTLFGLEQEGALEALGLEPTPARTSEPSPEARASSNDAIEDVTSEAADLPLSGETEPERPREE